MMREFMKIVESQEAVVENATHRFPWTMPPEMRAVISSWDVSSKSPYSDSFYDVATGEKTWSRTPMGSHRASDHWNFASQGSFHCPTDVPIVNQRYWALGRWDGERYVILKKMERVKLHEVPENEVARMPPKKREKRAKILQQLANRPDIMANLK